MEIFIEIKMTNIVDDLGNTLREDLNQGDIIVTCTRQEDIEE